VEKFPRRERSRPQRPHRPAQDHQIGIGLDKPSGHPPAPMPVPATLDYDRWLGSAPEQPYMERRVHPQNALEGRPGWITTEDSASA